MLYRILKVYKPFSCGAAPSAKGSPLNAEALQYGPILSPSSPLTVRDGTRRPSGGGSPTPLRGDRSPPPARARSPGVDLQLARRHVPARELIHAVVAPVVGGENAQQQRACLRVGRKARSEAGQPARDLCLLLTPLCSLPALRHLIPTTYLLPVDWLLWFLLNFLLGDAGLHRHLPPVARERFARLPIYAASGTGRRASRDKLQAFQRTGGGEGRGVPPHRRTSSCTAQAGGPRVALCT